MPHTCFVNGCRNRSDEGKSFFTVPAIIKHQGERTLGLSTKRRALWVAAINRKKEVTKYSKVCSDHFATGKPAALYDDTHPDWVPSLLMSEVRRNATQSESEKLLSRYRRSKSRLTKRIEDDDDDSIIYALNVEDMETDESFQTNCVFLKLGNVHLSQLHDEKSYEEILTENETLMNENHKIKLENNELRTKLLTFEFSLKAFEEDEKKVLPNNDLCTENYG